MENRVEIELNGTIVELLYNVDTGLYEVLLTAPDLIYASEHQLLVSVTDENEYVTTDNSQVINFVPLWREPKVDWSSEYDISGNYIGDYFNIEDWKRIMCNLIYLKWLQDKMYPDFEWMDLVGFREHDMFPQADQFNVIEKNIEALINNTFTFRVGKSNIYYANQTFPNYEDLNRIENACLTIYRGLTGQYGGLKRFPRRLGGGAFS